MSRAVRLITGKIKVTWWPKGFIEGVNLDIAECRLGNQPHKIKSWKYCKKISPKSDDIERPLIDPQNASVVKGRRLPIGHEVSWIADFSLVDKQMGEEAFSRLSVRILMSNVAAGRHGHPRPPEQPQDVRC